MEPLKFEDAIEAEEARLSGERDKMLEVEYYVSFGYQHFSYLSRGIYVDQLLRWSKFFDDELMLVLKSEDFFEYTSDTLRLVLSFLALPDWEPGASAISERGKNEGEYERKMDPAIRKRLEDFFEPHNERLYDYLGANFEW